MIFNTNNSTFDKSYLFDYPIQYGIINTLDMGLSRIKTSGNGWNLIDRGINTDIRTSKFTVYGDEEYIMDLRNYLFSVTKIEIKSSTESSVEEECVFGLDIKYTPYSTISCNVETVGKVINDGNNGLYKLTISLLVKNPPIMLRSTTETLETLIPQPENLDVSYKEDAKTVSSINGDSETNKSDFIDTIYSPKVSLGKDDARKLKLALINTRSDRFNFPNNWKLLPVFDLSVDKQSTFPSTPLDDYDLQLMPHVIETIRGYNDVNIQFGVFPNVINKSYLTKEQPHLTNSKTNYLVRIAPDIHHAITDSSVGFQDGIFNFSTLSYDYTSDGVYYKPNAMAENWSTGIDHSVDPRDKNALDLYSSTVVNVLANGFQNFLTSNEINLNNSRVIITKLSTSSSTNKVVFDGTIDTFELKDKIYSCTCKALLRRESKDSLVLLGNIDKFRFDDTDYIFNSRKAQFFPKSRQHSHDACFTNIPSNAFTVSTGNTLFFNVWHANDSTDDPNYVRNNLTDFGGAVLWVKTGNGQGQAVRTISRGTLHDDRPYYSINVDREINEIKAFANDFFGDLSPDVGHYWTSDGIPSEIVIEKSTAYVNKIENVTLNSALYLSTSQTTRDSSLNNGVLAMDNLCRESSRESYGSFHPFSWLSIASTTTSDMDIINNPTPIGSNISARMNRFHSYKYDSSGIFIHGGTSSGEVAVVSARLTKSIRQSVTVSLFAKVPFKVTSENGVLTESAISGLLDQWGFILSFSNINSDQSSTFPAGFTGVTIKKQMFSKNLSTNDADGIDNIVLKQYKDIELDASSFSKKGYSYYDSDGKLSQQIHVISLENIYADKDSFQVLDFDAKNSYRDYLLKEPDTLDYYSDTGTTTADMRIDFTFNFLVNPTTEATPTTELHVGLKNAFAGSSEFVKIADNDWSTDGYKINIEGTDVNTGRLSNNCRYLLSKLGVRDSQMDSTLLDTGSESNGIDHYDSFIYDKFDGENYNKILESILGESSYGLFRNDDGVFRLVDMGSIFTPFNIYNPFNVNERVEKVIDGDVLVKVNDVLDGDESKILNVLDDVKFGYDWRFGNYRYSFGFNNYSGVFDLSKLTTTHPDLINFLRSPDGSVYFNYLSTIYSTLQASQLKYGVRGRFGEKSEFKYLKTVDYDNNLIANGIGQMIESLLFKIYFNSYTKSTVKVNILNSKFFDYQLGDYVCIYEPYSLSSDGVHGQLISKKMSDYNGAVEFQVLCINDDLFTKFDGVINEEGVATIDPVNERGVDTGNYIDERSE